MLFLNFLISLDYDFTGIGMLYIFEGDSTKDSVCNVLYDFAAFL